MIAGSFHRSSTWRCASVSWRNIVARSFRPPAARCSKLAFGLGLNFALYGKQVETTFGIDPSLRLLTLARRRAAAAGIHADLLLGSATAIPLADNSVDSIVMTWTL